MGKRIIRRNTLDVRETCIFAMLGAVMFASKIIMEALPNIHLLGVLTVTYTVAYRRRALVPIYLYVMLNGLFAGFNFWWLPYTYIWTVLWAAVMLLPKNMPKKAAPIVYIAVSALHGFGYGVLYAPAQALMYGLSFEGMLAWIVAGFPFDAIHGISNLCCGVLIIPLVRILRSSEKLIK